jgi:hypothetical protein
MTKTLARDIAERMAWTFAETFSGSLLAAPMLRLDISTLTAAALAGAAAVLAVLKGLAASKVGEPNAALPS